MLAPHDLSPKPPRTPNSGTGKRFRPPVLDITQALERKPAVQLEIGPTPVKLHPGDNDEEKEDNNDEEDQDEEGEILQLSSPESPNFSLVGTGRNGVDEIEKELKNLEQLRKSVKKNLKLRPIRSRTNLKIDPVAATSGKPLTSSSTLPMPPSTASSWAGSEPPESALSNYFTPMTETPHHTAFIPGPSSHFHAPPLPTRTIITDEPIPIAATNTIKGPSLSTPRPIPAKELYDRLRSSKRPLLIDARSLAAHEAFHIRSSINIAIPSLILKRCKKPGGGFQTLNALRQYITTEHGMDMWDDLVGEGGGPGSNNSNNDQWDGDVVIYDDDMNPNDKNNVGSTAWAVLPVLGPLLSFGSVGYLEGGISSAGHDLDLQTLILSGDEAAAAVAGTLQDGTTTTTGTAVQAPQQPQGQQQKNGLLRKKASAGLFQLDTQTTYRARQLPEIEPPSTVDTEPPTGLPPPPRSPLPLMPTASSSSSSSSIDSMSAKSSSSPNTSITDSSPSPPPSSLAGFRRPPPPRRPSAPNLRRSMERINTDLPKLSLRTKPMRSATLAAPPSLTLQLPSSPSHLKLTHSSHSPITQNFGRPNGPASAYPSESFRTPFYTPPHSPGTPKARFDFSLDVTASTPPLPDNSLLNVRNHNNSSLGGIPDPPPTARPDAGFDFDRPLSTGEEEDSAFQQFVVSTILPNFLFLGPELTTKEHVDELRGLGVKRILNIAAECDDDQGLGLRQVFDKYLRIPMRDTVEEDNITRGVREVCDFLDDARLHSAPTYVHCKAGKSRSVTAVMAYLIHANRWTLSRAYSFVMERRKGISPNIGFVSELMNFEEQELGNKSNGVQPSAPVGPGGTTIDMQDGFAAAIASGDRGGPGHGPGHGHSQSVSGVMLGSGASTGSSYHSGRGGPHHPATAHMVRSRTYVRDSLPSHMGTGDEEEGSGGPPVDIVDRMMGDPGGEVEIKDASGRYRHARRPPVNASTLQPMRRASKAGLESFVAPVTASGS